MKQVGIYRRIFPLRSEAFIKEQIDNFKNYQPTVVTSKLVNQTTIPTYNLCPNDSLGLKQFIYILLENPVLFNDLNGINHLQLIHAHFGPDAIWAMSVAKRLKIPLLVTFHGFDITISRRFVWRTGKLLYYKLLWNETELQSFATQFIAVSKYIQCRLLEQGYPQEKVIHHYIGVDVNKFTPSPSDHRTQRYILCVGRHTEKKGISTLLKAFAMVAKRHPDVTLIQVGSGKLTQQYLQLVDQLGIANRVVFMGSQPHEKILELMQNAEIFALPSQQAKNGDCEGLPIVINEASACGLPVVSTYHSGIPEAVIDGETGFLVEEKNAIQLKDKLDILLSDQQLSRKMGLAGRELVCEVFNIQKQSSKLESIYDSLIAS